MFVIGRLGPNGYEIYTEGPSQAPPVIDSGHLVRSTREVVVAMGFKTREEAEDYVRENGLEGTGATVVEIDETKAISRTRLPAPGHA